MKITLSPQRRNDSLTLVKAGDVLTINDVAYDFGPLPEGATLPQAAVDCPWLADDVTRQSGAVHLVLTLPIGEFSSDAARFPLPIESPPDGVIALPDQVDAVIGVPTAGAIDFAKVAFPKAPARTLTRAQFVVALTQTMPPILTEAEALQSLERWPDKFAAALADKSLAYRAAAVETWRTIGMVARDAPLFLDLLSFYAAQAGLSAAQAAALGDAIFARPSG